jgi:hypothetical protein
MKCGSETDLVKACLHMLAWTNVVADAWRNNTGATVYQDQNGARRFTKFGRKGTSDILGITSTGRFLAIECKQPKGRLTPEQREFLGTVDRAGGVALVIRDPLELQVALTHLAADPAWMPRRAEGTS